MRTRSRLQAAYSFFSRSSWTFVFANPWRNEAAGAQHQSEASAINAENEVGQGKPRKLRISLAPCAHTHVGSFQRSLRFQSPGLNPWDPCLPPTCRLSISHALGLSILRPLARPSCPDLSFNLSRAYHALPRLPPALMPFVLLPILPRVCPSYCPFFSSPPSSPNRSHALRRPRLRPLRSPARPHALRSPARPHALRSSTRSPSPHPRPLRSPSPASPAFSLTRVPFLLARSLPALSLSLQALSPRALSPRPVRARVGSSPRTPASACCSS